jgi:hypothetical protein
VHLGFCVPSAPLRGPPPIGELLYAVLQTRVSSSAYSVQSHAPHLRDPPLSRRALRSRWSWCAGFKLCCVYDRGGEFGIHTDGLVADNELGGWGKWASKQGASVPAPLGTRRNETQPRYSAPGWLCKARRQGLACLG